MDEKIKNKVLNGLGLILIKTNTVSDDSIYKFGIIFKNILETIWLSQELSTYIFTFYFIFMNLFQTLHVINKYWEEKWTKRRLKRQRNEFGNPVIIDKNIFAWVLINMADFCSHYQLSLHIQEYVAQIFYRH